MKIKKKDYEAAMDDRFWDGVQSGMRYALQYPEDAKKYVDNIQALRSGVTVMKKKMQPLFDALASILRR